MVLALESRRQIEFAPMVWVEGFWESFFETFAGRILVSLCLAAQSTLY